MTTKRHRKSDPKSSPARANGSKGEARKLTAEEDGEQLQLQLEGMPQPALPAAKKPAATPAAEFQLTDQASAALIRSEQLIKTSSKAPNTAATYRDRLRVFDRIIDELRGGPDPNRVLTVDDTCIFLVHYVEKDGRKLSSAKLTLAAVRNRWLAENPTEPSPTNHPRVTALLKALARTVPVEQVRRDKAQPLKPADLVAMLEVLDEIIDKGKRTPSEQEQMKAYWTAYLLTAFFSAFRVNELILMEPSCLTFSEQGVTIRIPRSKGDQLGAGARVVIHRNGSQYCPVAALERWLALNPIKTRVFPAGFRMWRTPSPHDAVLGLQHPSVGNEGYADALHRLCEKRRQQLIRWMLKAGIKPEAADRYLGTHSTRRGFATGAFREGADILKVHEHLRHKSLDQTYDYIDDLRPWEDNPTSRIAM